MAPKTKFSKEDILNEAFQMAVEQGMSEISVRKLSARLGCSVAPIYVNFKNTEELAEAVKQEISSRLMKYSSTAYTNLSFYNIGIGQILFAKHYPNLMRDIITHQIAEPVLAHVMLSSMLDLMRQDPLLEGISDEQLLHLLASMSYLTQGICVQIISNPSDTVDAAKLIRLLGLAGSQLIYGSKMSVPEQLMQAIRWNMLPEDMAPM